VGERNNGEEGPCWTLGTPIFGIGLVRAAGAVHLVLFLRAGLARGPLRRCPLTRFDPHISLWVAIAVIEPISEWLRAHRLSGKYNGRNGNRACEKQTEWAQLEMRDKLSTRHDRKSPEYAA